MNVFSSAFGRVARTYIRNALLARVLVWIGAGYVRCYPYFNDVTPDAESTIGDFNSQTGGPGAPMVNGYVGMDSTSVVGGVNTNGELTIVDNLTQYSDTVSVGSSSLGLSIYGYLMVTDNGDIPGNFISAVRFNEPIPLTYDGQIVQFPFEMAFANEIGGSGS